MNKNQFLKTALSTNTTTPFQTPFRSGRQFTISPVILKQKLCIKSKEKPIIHIKSNCRKKQKYKNQYGQLAPRNSINWIIYNILVGIYKNWLRLAPFILRYLTHTKGDMLKDVQKLIDNAIQQKQRIQQLLNKFKNKMSQNRNNTDFTQGFFQESDKLLQQIQNVCNKLKLSTHLFSGQILAQKRCLKTQKQNQLADAIFDCMDKNKGNFQSGKKLILNDDLSKLVDTIIDRIAVVKYMKKNNLKINESLLKPLKNIFINDKNFEDVNNITVAKVIQKIKARFSLNLGQNSKMNINNQRKINTTKQLINNKQKQQTKGNDKKNSNKSKQQIQQNNQNKQKFTDFQNNEQQKQSGSQFQYEKQQDCGQFRQSFMSGKSLHQLAMKSQRDFKTRKKIGIYLESQQNQSGFEQLLQVKKSKRNLQKFNQRKVVLQKKKKMSGFMNDLNLKNNSNLHEQNNQKSKTKRRTSKIYKIQFDSKQKIKQKTKQKDRYNQKSKRVSIRLAQKERNMQHNGQSDKKVTNNSIIEGNSSDSQQSCMLNVKNKKMAQLKSRNYIKPAKLLKKKFLKKQNSIFDNFDLDNFDLELQAESNVVNKKRKILNLFKTLESSGLIQTKSIRKIVANAKKLQDQFGMMGTKKKLLKRIKPGEDTPLTSFFMIPPPQQAQKQLGQNQECNPYEYLIRFNKQAIKNWFSGRQFRRKQSFKLQQFQRGRYSGIDCDLDIPTLKKQVLKNKFTSTRWVDKQLLALQLGLKWCKQFNENIIKQKSINIQKQYVVN